jgi:hypothetical protein
MASDIEGIDEIIETPSAIQLVFHVRHDWLGEADQAAAETARKREACTGFLRSQDFRTRFGMRPGTILMKSARQPPPDVLADMARIGADVEVGTIGVAGGPPVALVACAACGRSGFVSTQMSVTERGLTCPACFAAWSMQQDLRGRGNYGSLTSSGGGMSAWTIARILIALAVISLSALRACS